MFQFFGAVIGRFRHASRPLHRGDAPAFVLRFYGSAMKVAILDPLALRGP
jgi:hypothetical protein